MDTTVSVSVTDTVSDTVSVADKKTKFTPPSLDDIKKYIEEKKLNVNPQQFYDYFTTGNWIDSKGQKVKNWKQKLLTWNKYSPINQEKPQANKFVDENNNKDFSQYYANIGGS